jgi:hypothetical protein
VDQVIQKLIELVPALCGRTMSVSPLSGGMGDRFFDLGNLAVNNQFEEQHELFLLRRYFGEVRSDHLRRLRLMRLASDLRESMWGFLQAGISTLDIDYIAYGRTYLDRFLEGCVSLGVPRDGAGGSDVSERQTLASRCAGNTV